MGRDPINVLLVEDNRFDARLIEEMLGEAKNGTFRFECVNTLSRGLDRMAAGGVDVILLDLNLPDSKGLDTFSKAQEAAPRIPIIPLTGVDDEDLGARLIRAGAQDYLVKGEVRSDLLAGAIRYAIERKKAEQALRRSEERYRSLFESTGTAIVVLQEDWTIFLANGEFARLTGYSKEELEGKMSWRRFVGDRQLQRMASLAEEDRPEGEVVRREHDMTILDRHRNPRPVFMTWAPMEGNEGYVVSLVDITDYRKMEEELLRARKLESVGMLAGGIAHDFNNALTAVLGNISLAKAAAGSDSMLLERLADAERGALRAQELTRQLLTFAKGGAPVKKMAHLGEVVRAAAHLTLAGSNVRCETTIQEGLWPAEVDDAQIRQVVSNLLLNAVEAMPRGGTIELQVKNVSFRAGDGLDTLPLPSGEYVQISVLDHGEGIHKRHLSRIFDPYFTTKPGGSGMGLAIAHSIVDKHSGTIAVKSVPGVGTAFKIYLPACKGGEQPSRAEEERIVLGHGRVLVMDDEEIIRLLVDDLLESLGYEGDFASDGEEALRMYSEAQRSGRPYDAVIMDLTIPGGMGGKEAMAKLLVMDPDAKVIVSSGYANDPIMADYERYGFKGVMPKPYRVEHFSRVLAEVVGHPDRSEDVSEED